MNYSALRLPSLVLATTALISLVSASSGSAQVNTRCLPSARPPRYPGKVRRCAFMYRWVRRLRRVRPGRLMGLP
jgi:hypothetical protein